MIGEPVGLTFFDDIIKSDYVAKNYIVVHGAYTLPTQDIGAKVVDHWHRHRRPPFLMIGYHFFIRRNGRIELGRPIVMNGAHCPGRNHDGIGICMAGGQNFERTSEANYTAAQWRSLEWLVQKLRKAADIPLENIGGHEDYQDNRTCPYFDVKAWAGSLEGGPFHG